ncbi:hypothetical protein GGS21DRAFT_500715 [Xylaria nigripes]|nr:hypothetical protein GGS21DRAFT_500715 [Xylaria nigripes]
MDRDSRSRRYDDGEVTRYGAGESYRPYNSNRSPRRARSPPLRERPRSPLDSDRYVPDRAPRRRSRSIDRYRREPSRDRRDLRDMRDVRDAGGDSWRRDDRSRNLRRSPLPRRSPPRRSPPRRSPPRRFSPRRDDRDRARSPRRGFDSRFHPMPQTDNPNYIPLTAVRHRRRSRSPLDRDRLRDRTPPRRSPPPLALRASTYRGRSRSPDRRGDDRYGPTYARRPSPPRESAISSALPSRTVSQRSSPRPDLFRRDDRSHPETPIPQRPASRSSHGGATAREKTPQKTPLDSQPGQSGPSRSPPRGPAALRAPPTGPRDSRGYGSQPTGLICAPRPAAISNSSSTVGRQENAPTGPPSGPRGFTAVRGGGYGRGGRGGSAWSSSIQSRPAASGPASASVTPTSSNIPTGPRSTTIPQSIPSAASQTKPFNPPKGPAADSNRPSLAQQLITSMPPIIPGGKMDPSYIPLTTGVLPELQTHMDRLKEEEEKLREEKYIKEEKLRKSLAAYEKGERETKVMALRTELAEQSLKKFAGEGLGGAAF